MIDLMKHEWLYSRFDVLAAFVFPLFSPLSIDVDEALPHVLG